MSIVASFKWQFQLVQGQLADLDVATKRWYT